MRSSTRKVVTACQVSLRGSFSHLQPLAASDERTRCVLLLPARKESPIAVSKPGLELAASSSTPGCSRVVPVLDWQRLSTGRPCRSRVTWLQPYRTASEARDRIVSTEQRSVDNRRHPKTGRNHSHNRALNPCPQRDPYEPLGPVCPSRPGLLTAAGLSFQASHPRTHRRFSTALMRFLECGRRNAP
jgi:hypothetical protein